MNVGMLLLLFVVAIGAVFGLYMIGNSADASVIDTYGNTTGALTNGTQDAVQNMTSTGLTVAGGAVLFIGFIIMLVVLIALYMVATKRY